MATLKFGCFKIFVKLFMQIESKMSRKFNPRSEFCELKVNLRSIRFSSVFLGFCLSSKKYALFLPHFFKSIFALSSLLHYDKNSVQKAIFQNRAVLLYEKCFRKTFVQYVTVWLVRIWTYKNADEKSIVFHEEKTHKRERKADTA